MSKAEEAALKAYPNNERKVFHSAFGTLEIDDNAPYRKGYVQGYYQAEKDNELTWEDIEKIVDLYDDVYCDFSIDGNGGKINAEEHYQEVLKRFKDFKERENGSKR